MITGIEASQLKAVIYLRNTKPDQFAELIAIIELLADQGVDALKSSSNIEQMFKNQGAIHSLEELLALLNNLNTALAQIES